MSERFFVEPAIQSPRVTLVGDEVRHLAAVMRAKAGDEVMLFDGSGVEFAAQIVRIGKRDAELEIIQRREISRELSFDLILAVALPKGERQKWLVEKLTELGVTRLVPLIADRGVAEPTPAAIERLKRGVIEASKQCGRNRLLEIAPPRRAAELFADVTLPTPRLIADPDGRAEIPARGEHTIVAVGPEGGFSSAERSAAEMGHWQPVSLGPRILRIETAAVALAAAISVQPAASS